jgi:hypothetical protein
MTSLNVLDVVPTGGDLTIFPLGMEAKDGKKFKSL